MSYRSPAIGKTLLLTALGLIVVVPTAKWIGRTAAEAQNAREGRSGDYVEELNSMDRSLPVAHVVVSRQGAEGVTVADLTPEFLQNLNAWTQERLRANGAKHGLPADQLTTESVYVESGSQKYAVTRISDGVFKPSAIIFGIKGSEAVRITCGVREKADVELMTGPCNEKVREVFGVPLNALSAS